VARAIRRGTSIKPDEILPAISGDCVYAVLKNLTI
jgi:hypothetical protein